MAQWLSTFLHVHGPGMVKANMHCLRCVDSRRVQQTQEATTRESSKDKKSLQDVTAPHLEHYCPSQQRHEPFGQPKIFSTYIACYPYIILY